MTDGHPRLTCIGIPPDEDCDRPIVPRRDYMIHPGVWRCRDCHEKWQARMWRTDAGPKHRMRDESE